MTAVFSRAVALKLGGGLKFASRILLASVVGAEAAHAATLELGAHAPPWAQVGAAVLLYLHIGGGAVGLVTGVIASLARKGGAAHRLSGKVFVGAMFVAYVIGAGVAPFLSEGQRPNFVAGVLALYLLATGVSAARRRKFDAGPAELAGLVVALAITGVGVWFMIEGAASESGTVDGSPPQAFAVFVVAGLAASAGEINVIVRRSLSNGARVSRHLWRMCASFFFASGSLFLGQPKVFPDWFNASILPVFLAFAPVLLMTYWLIRQRGSQR